MAKTSLSNKNFNTIVENEVNKAIDYIINNYGLLQHKDEIIENVSKLIDKNHGKVKRKKAEIPENEKCQGRKIDNTQCTRRCKIGETYCGSHLKNLPFGYMGDGITITPKEKGKRGRKKKEVINKQYIETWIDTQLGDNYLIDKNGLVYKNDPEHPELLGIKKNGKIEQLTELPDSIFT
jgi:hypothetical protein